MNEVISLAIPFHEYADWFPMMVGEDFEGLKADIAKHGVREPIVIYDGQILDGRNRYQCARALGIECPMVDFAGDDPLDFVISHNLHRRHLNESQRASVAAKVANAPAHRPNKTANLRSSAEAAAMLNVSQRSVETARKVHETAPPEIVRAVDEGRISVSLAGKVADLPEEDQAEIIAAPPEQQRQVAREIVNRTSFTGNNEWYTPQEHIEAARTVMGAFDLDPASSEIANRTVRAARYFTEADNGLAQQWSGRIWLNPPYAQPAIFEFMEKAANEWQAGNVREMIILTHNYTDTRWFQLAAQAATAICFTRGRIRFESPTGEKAAPTQGQAFFYFGPNLDAFLEQFRDIGFVVEVRQ